MNLLIAAFCLMVNLAPPSLVDIREPVIDYVSDMVYASMDSLAFSQTPLRIGHIKVRVFLPLCIPEESLIEGLVGFRNVGWKIKYIVDKKHQCWRVTLRG